MFQLEFHPDWDKYFHDFAPDIQTRIWKKIDQIEKGLKCRHLGHGIPFFVAEIGQNRVVFSEYKQNNVRKIFFAGKHKDYERWLRGFK